MIVRAVNETHIREMQHCIGLDYKKPRRGKYKAYRNYCVYNAPNYKWDHLVSIGYAELRIEEREDYIPHKQYYYSLTKDGLDFMGMIAGCTITEMD